MIKMVSRVNGIGGQLGRRNAAADYDDESQYTAIPEGIEG